MHPALEKGNLALVTGGASGIGRAIAERLVEAEMRVCIADLPSTVPSDVAREIGAAAGVALDVADLIQLEQLKTLIEGTFGPVTALFNNAGIQPGSSLFSASNLWRRILDVNLWGVINGTQAFAPDMMSRGTPGLIVNTGSKQGITCPPGDPAYNISKAGVKAFTEALQHTLRNTLGSKVEARLFIPGWVHTKMSAHGRTEKPEGAWSPEQAVAFLFEALEGESFYILCPDNDVDRAMDEKRIAWAAADMIEDRPPLSRWHPDYGAAFAEWMKP